MLGIMSHDEVLSMKRISFRLSRKLAEKFDLEAEKRGVTKASLLREWIDEFNTIGIQSNHPHKNGMVYNFRIDDEQYEKLCVKSLENHQSISEVIRVMIHSGIFSGKSPFVTEKAKDYFDRTSELIYKAEYSTAISFLESIHNDLEKFPISDYLFLKLTEAEIYYEMRDFTFAKQIINGLSYFIDESSSVKAYALFLKAEILSMEDEVSQALDYYQKALGLVPDNNIIRLRIVLSLAALNTYELDSISANNYLVEAKSILKNIDNQFLRARIYREESHHLVFNNRYDLAEKLLSKAYLIIKNNNYSVEESYYWGDKVRIFLSKGEFRSVRGVLMKVGKNVSNVRAQFLHEIFLNNSIPKKQVRKELADYFQYSSQYINSRNFSNQAEGRGELLKIANNGSCKMMKVAARKTLLTKSIQFVR
jgi:tetratricopeptide (TPR) repeat protein